MLTVDLKSLKSLENMRGVFYVLAVCSVISPALLALYVTDFRLLQSNTLVAVLLALSAGLLCTALFTLSAFVDALASTFLSAAGRMRSGTSALAIGPLMSLLLQCCALGLCAYSNYNFRTYLFATIAFPFVLGLQSAIRFAVALNRVEKETTKNINRIKEIRREREEIQTEIAQIEARLSGGEADKLSGQEKEEIARRFAEAKTRMESNRYDLDELETTLNRLRRRAGFGPVLK